jgi:bifunctional non-homologous end joining protein LigD
VSGAPPEGLKPIPGTHKAGAGEPVYKKPKLPPKEAIVAFYELVAPLLLRDAARRPLNLLRCTAGHCFYQRNRNHPATDEGFEPPIRLVPIAQKNGRTEEYLYVEDEAGVAACARADAVEFHAWGSRAEHVEQPDRIAFDLDPGEGIGFVAVREAALTMRAALAAIDLESFPLLSGGKGIHVVVPFAPEGNWDQVRGFARRLCEALAELEPERFTISLPKAQRKGRIFLDFLRNQRTATAIMPWSLRARAGAPVAAPVSWDELPSITTAARYTIMETELLLQRAGNPTLSGWGRSDQRLPRLR